MPWMKAARWEGSLPSHDGAGSGSDGPGESPELAVVDVGVDCAARCSRPRGTLRMVETRIAGTRRKLRAWTPWDLMLFNDCSSWHLMSYSKNPSSTSSRGCPSRQTIWSRISVIVRTSHFLTEAWRNPRRNIRPMVAIFLAPASRTASWVTPPRRCPVLYIRMWFNATQVHQPTGHPCADRKWFMLCSVVRSNSTSITMAYFKANHRSLLIYNKPLQHAMKMNTTTRIKHQYSKY